MFFNKIFIITNYVKKKKKKKNQEATSQLIRGAEKLPSGNIKMTIKIQEEIKMLSHRNEIVFKVIPFPDASIDQGPFKSWICANKENKI